ncbi:DB module [Dictyocaulus viviparus]|uniref:DB module n=1 Tax=Dictyocaulus viviparus TaxID=29172 RepID=A0A0D8Y682_DICVI|nr:DB module [Dictyocaulus viviparus]
MYNIPLSLTLFFSIASPTYTCMPFGCLGGLNCASCLFGLCTPPRCIGGVCLAARARAARTYKDDAGVIQSVNTQNPNERFSTCCSLLDVPQKCQQLCSFEDYNITAVRSLLSFDSSCPVSNLPMVHFCASGGVDHSRCCRAAGIQPQCLQFCDQRPDKNQELTFSHISCMDQFDDIKSCFVEHAITEYYRSKQTAVDQSYQQTST